MPAWVYALAVAAVGWSVFVVVCRPFQRGAHAAPRALPVTRVDLPAVGSMSLADERTLYPLPWPRPEGDWLPQRPAPEFLSAPPLGHIHNGSCADDRCWDGGPGRKPLGPYGGQLGPRARVVLARYDARCRERWGFSLS